MRLKACLVALAVLTAAAPARAASIRLVCSGIVTDSTSRAQAKKAAPFRLELDVEQSLVLFNGEPAAEAIISEETIRFSRTAAREKQRIPRIIGQGRSKLFGEPTFEYEVSRRSGLWSTKGSSGLCRKTDETQNLF